MEGEEWVVQEFGRFVAGGIGNTLVTYALYLGLLSHCGYQLAYVLSFTTGVLLAYWINVRLVFRKEGTWRKLVTFPVVYVAQFGVGAVVLWAAVGVLGVPAWSGPAVAVAVTVPLTYLLSRWILSSDGGAS